MMTYVLHDMQRIIWVVSWKQIVNFVLICEQATLAIANDADDANAKKKLVIKLKSLTVYQYCILKYS